MRPIGQMSAKELREQAYHHAEAALAQHSSSFSDELIREQRELSVMYANLATMRMIQEGRAN